MYFFVTMYLDTNIHSGLHRKVKRVLSELLAEHWGEMICQTNSNTVRWKLFAVKIENISKHFYSSRYTQLFQDGIIPTAAQLNNRPTSGIDRLQQDFLDLDVEAVCEIFSLKSEQVRYCDDLMIETESLFRRRCRTSASVLDKLICVKV